MNDTRRMTALSLLVAFALIFTFGLGAITSYVLSQPENVQGSPTVRPPADTSGAPNPTSVSSNNGVPADLDQQMQVFYEAMRLVQDEYYGRPVDNQKMI